MVSQSLGTEDLVGRKYYSPKIMKDLPILSVSNLKSVHAGHTAKSVCVKQSPLKLTSWNTPEHF